MTIARKYRFWYIRIVNVYVYEVHIDAIDDSITENPCGFHEYNTI